jgi:hypothetical protein
LIAPPSVIFFNAKWEDLGTRQSLKAQIIEITTIQAEVLEDSERRYKFSVAQKMSWASRRETTRAEDIAYCLLGIFAVNIPMLYGEGNHAFIRLQEEIMRKTNDHSIFAWSNSRDANGMSSSNLLANSPAMFSGSGNIIQSQGRATGPFSLTNKGIHLCLQVRGLKNTPLVLAVLDCQEGVNEEKRLGIYLEPEPGGADLYRRFSGSGLAKVHVKEIPELERKDLFVKQQWPVENIACYNSQYVAIDGLEANGLILQDSYPGTVQINGLSKLSAATAWNTKILNVLRFSDKDGDGFVVVIKSEWKRSSLTLNIFEICDVLTLANLSIPGTARLSKILGKIPSVKYKWDENGSDRVIWQHPLKKWWISLMTKRNMECRERRETVYIRWHIPEEESIFKIVRYQCPTYSS